MLKLESIDEALASGDCGPAAARAMNILIKYCASVDAERFVSVTGAHIDGCLYHGPASLDFAEMFVRLGGTVRVPTTLNVAGVDVVHPEWNKADPELVPAQERLTELHKELGCFATMTCAPYQRIIRPQFGQHIAWAESNAIVFANSVLGARTDRYGDFTDLCAALTGRVPFAGLHRGENRIPELIVDVPPLANSGLARDLYFAAIGYALGTMVRGRVPLLVGLPDDTTEDEFKALGAAAASSGAVALFHARGLTPEAKVDAAIAHPRGATSAGVTSQDLRAVTARLCRLEIGEPVAAMCLGTPHFSLNEFEQLGALVAGQKAAPDVEVFISTSREIATVVETSPLGATLSAFGVRIVVDVCTYVAPVVGGNGAIVTNSAKYAHYGPGNLKRRVGLMGMERCIRSAIQGQVVS